MLQMFGMSYFYFILFFSFLNPKFKDFKSCVKDKTNNLTVSGNAGQFRRQIKEAMFSDPAYMVWLERVFKR